jgi:hypothetical protein
VGTTLGLSPGNIDGVWVGNGLLGLLLGGAVGGEVGVSVVGAKVGLSVGDGVGERVGATVGLIVGNDVGESVGLELGELVGLELGISTISVATTRGETTRMATMINWNVIVLLLMVDVCIAFCRAATKIVSMIHSKAAFPPST